MNAIQRLVILFFLGFIKLISNNTIKEGQNNKINTFIFPKNIDFDSYREICKETININHEKCLELSISYEKIINPLLLSSYFSAKNSAIINSDDKQKISFIYFNLGNIYYHGHSFKEPNLYTGLAYFLISSFFGAAESKYFLSIILTNNIFEQIYNDNKFKNLVKENKILKEISKTDFYLNNFNFLIKYREELSRQNTTKRMISQKIEELRTNIAISFLFSSALQNYFPAKLLLAYKLHKGYNIRYSCANAMKYYIDIAKDTIKELHNIHSKVYYNVNNLQNFEYIGNKFDKNNVQDPKSVIELYWNKITNKKDKLNLEIITTLAKIYYYGSSGVEQNYNTSFKLFTKAANLNDSDALFYLGEHYLNGWGTKQNYSKAFELFNESMTVHNNSQSWNSLGYMYYYGLGVKQNIDKAFDYFKIGISYKDSAAYYDMVYLLLENQKQDKNRIKTDYDKAYKYASHLASQSLSFGTYLYAMMNQYNIGAMINSCDINLPFFKSIVGNSLYIKYLTDLAYEYYNNKMYRKSFLIYMELAELGINTGAINTAILLDNYNIFIDKNFQKFLTYKYYKMSYDNNDALASLRLGDFFYNGYGSLKPNIEIAKNYYEMRTNLGISADNFIVSNSYFNLGMIYYFKENSTNRTNDTYMGNMYMNISQENEELAVYPSKLVKMYMNYFWDSENSESSFIKNFFGMFVRKLKNTFKGIIFSWKLYFILANTILYFLFYHTLKQQKE